MIVHASGKAGIFMIAITKLNQTEVVVNCDLIETIESTPDTTISLTTNKKLIVKDSVDEVLSKIVAYKRSLNEKTFI